VREIHVTDPTREKKNKEKCQSKEVELHKNRRHKEQSM